MDILTIFVASAVVDEVARDALDLDPSRVQLFESLAVSDATLHRFGLLLLAEAETGGSGTRLFADALTRALAFHLLRAYSAQASRAPPPPSPMAGWRLSRAIEYMQAYLADELPLSQVAEAAGLSPSHFARAFRAATGEPPHRYLIHLRIEKARELLEQTRLPIIDVGMQCGFEAPSHFATMFRKVTGLSPRAWRAARVT